MTSLISSKLIANKTYTLHRATIADVPTISHPFVTAHLTEPTIANLMKDCESGAEAAFYGTAIESILKNEEGAEMWIVKAEEQSEPVGMALWHNPSKMSDVEHYPVTPAGVNESLCEEFFTRMEHTEKSLFSSHGGGENFYFLHYIFIAPSHQELGLGSWMMRCRLNEIDKDELKRKTLLIATPAARQLYSKLGFSEVDGFDIDLKSRGIEGDGHWSAMVRDV